MALQDRETLTVVTSEDWVLLLEGGGIITNMSNVNNNLIYRYDIDKPLPTSVGRVLYGRPDGGEKDSFVNDDADSKVYGKAYSGKVSLLITDGVYN